MKRFSCLLHRSHVLAIVMIVALLSGSFGAVGIANTANAAPGNTSIIDHFETSAQSLTLTVGGTTSGFFSDQDIDLLGGERDVYAVLSSGDPGQAMLSTVNDSGSSRFDWTLGNNVAGYVEIQYDGSADTTKSDIDFTNGLQGDDANLTLTGADTLIVGVPFNDQGAPVQVKFYEDSTHCTVVTVMNIPANSFNTRLYEFPLSTSGASACSGFSHVTGFSNIKAVVIRISTGTHPGADVAIHLVGLVKAPYFDYGDIPNDVTHGSYDTDPDSNTGTGVYARHLIKGSVLGTSVSEENTKLSLPGDNNVEADADNGVSRTGRWTAGTTASGNGGHVAVLAGNCTGTCYVTAFVDWNRDGNFWDIDSETLAVVWDSQERILSDAPVTFNGGSPQTLDFDIPTTVTAGTNTYYARFRITDENLGGGGSPWGTYYSGEVEDYAWTQPLAVNLASFTAVNAGDHNALAWETASELKNLGFNVWRGTSASAPDVKLNEFVIPSQAPGGTDGFAYSYNDFDIAGGINYYYWLEDVDLNGTVTRHGPVSPSGDSPTAVTLTALQGNRTTSALPWVALGVALLAGVGVVVGRRRS